VPAEKQHAAIPPRNCPENASSVLLPYDVSLPVPFVLPAHAPAEMATTK
jgi:hypothetical protein